MIVEDYEEFKELISAELLGTDLYQSTIFREYGPADEIEKFLEKMKKEGLIKSYLTFNRDTKFRLTRSGLWEAKRAGVASLDVWASRLIDEWEDVGK